MISVKDRAPLYPGRVQLSPVAGQANRYDLTREDEPTEIGTPLNRRTMQLLQADIRTHPIAPGNTVSAGDVVDVVGGEVGKTWQANVNKKSVFNGDGSTSEIAVCKLTESVGVVGFYQSGTSSRVYTINPDNSLSFGAHATPGENGTHISIERLSASMFVKEYSVSNVLKAWIGTVSGTTITYGAPATISGAGTSYNKLIYLSETSFISLYNRLGLRAKVCTVSGTTITPGTESYLPGSTNAAYISSTRLPNAPNGDKRVCVCYSDAADGNKGKAVIITINASNVVSWGAPVVFEGMRITYPVQSKCASDGDYIVVAYRPVSGGSSTFVRAMKSIGNAITEVGDEFDNGKTNTANIALEIINGDIALFYGVGNTSEAMMLQRDSLVLEPGNPFVFNNGNLSDPAPVALDDNKVLLAFRDTANNAYGTATLLAVRGDQIAGSFADVSSQAIALQSGTAGQSIDIIYDGVAELPGITAGAQITSPGVQGYAPQDGWLWVRPEWEGHYGLKVATGTYVGTGTFGVGNKNTLTFDFEPQSITIYHPTVGESGGSPWGRDVTVGRSHTAGSSVKLVTLEWTGNNLSWYGESASFQLNTAGIVHRFVAIGTEVPE